MASQRVQSLILYTVCEQDKKGEPPFIPLSCVQRTTKKKALADLREERRSGIAEAENAYIAKVVYTRAD